MPSRFLTLGGSEAIQEAIASLTLKLIDGLLHLQDFVSVIPCAGLAKKPSPLNAYSLCTLNQSFRRTAYDPILLDHSLALFNMKYGRTKSQNCLRAQT